VEVVALCQLLPQDPGTMLPQNYTLKTSFRMRDAWGTCYYWLHSAPDNRLA
jgi:hypothetical protein